MISLITTFNRKYSLEGYERRDCSIGRLPLEFFFIDSSQIL